MLLDNHTWSPLFNPTSSALDPLSTFDMKVAKPVSYPPSIEKCKTSSLVDRANVMTLLRAFVEQAMFRSLCWPHIF